MKRKTLLLDEVLLAEVTRVLGVQSHSAAVNLALAETLRVKKLLEISNFFGTGIWEGDLSAMRGDRRKRRKNGKA
ncbi:MAG TPA: type II toxin-antitoxin system VapB family antitoxin [Bryobacteraceae bacterium]|nr:type II toxin-antitoxin system VapB family antitoxin [Bryobacteraceae bacterium]